jgi:N-acetylglutamate synthase-like GNAT family acetyltransferase
LIRQAVPEDRAAVQRLYEFLCPGEPVRVIASRIEQIAEDPTHFLLVHQTEGKIDGTVFLSFCPDPMFGTLPFTIVGNLIVSPDAENADETRQKLMHAVEKLAREQRSTKVMVLNSSASEQSLYQTLGYVRDVTRLFKKHLDSEKEKEANA